MFSRATTLLLLSLFLSSDAFTPSGFRTMSMKTATFATEEPAAEDAAEGDVAEKPVDDILSSPAFLKKKLEVLKEDIAKTESDIEVAKAEFEANKEAMGDKIEQLKLEFENMQSRSIKQSTGDEKSKVEVARAIVEVIDNYDRAFAAVDPDSDVKKEIEAAYQQSYANFLSVLKEDLGVEPVESIGKEFDYEVHNAVTVMPSDEYDEGIVCAELQRGYVLGDNLIRAAMVAVAN